jgi:hypothetical protein
MKGFGCCISYMGEIIIHKNSGLVGFCTWPLMELIFGLLDLEVVFIINRFQTF